MSNEVAQKSRFFGRITTYPILTVTYGKASSYYTWAKSRNTYIASTLNLAESSLTKAVSLVAQPVIRRLDKSTITSLDSMACSQLDRLDTMCPALRQPTSEIVEDWLDYYHLRVKPAIDTAMIPVKGAAQISSHIFNRSPIIISLRENIEALSKEWQKAKKEVGKQRFDDVTSQKTQGPLEAAQKWAGYLRLSLEATGHVINNQLSRENRQRLTEAKYVAHQIYTSLMGVTHVNELTEAFFVQSKAALQLVQDAMEKCVHYIMSFNPLSKKTASSDKKGLDSGVDITEETTSSDEDDENDISI